MRDSAVGFGLGLGLAAFLYVTGVEALAAGTSSGVAPAIATIASFLAAVWTYAITKSVETRFGRIVWLTIITPVIVVVLVMMGLFVVIATVPLAAAVFLSGRFWLEFFLFFVLPCVLITAAWSAAYLTWFGPSSSSTTDQVTPHRQ